MYCTCTIASTCTLDCILYTVQIAYCIHVLYNVQIAYCIHCTDCTTIYVINCIKCIHYLYLSCIDCKYILPQMYLKVCTFCLKDTYLWDNLYTLYIQNAVLRSYKKYEMQHTNCTFFVRLVRIISTSVGCVVGWLGCVWFGLWTSVFCCLGGCRSLVWPGVECLCVWPE
jgi:hypothetical protein